MKLADIPAKFRAPFAVAADPADIRAIPNTTATPGLASLQAGFPPENFQPVASGGIPPSGADFNGLFFQISGWSQWSGAGGLTIWDSTFSTQIGGYPKGALISTNPVGGLWLNTVDDNTTNPDASGAGWTNPLNLTGYALLASPHFTGVPTAPTATGGTNTTQLATCAFVTAAVAGIGTIVSSFNSRTGAVSLTSGDVTGALTYTPANIASPTFTGIPAAPTASPGTNTTQVATTAFVTAAVAAATAGVASFNGRTGTVVLSSGDVTGALGFTPANIASPTFTGTPSGPTAAGGTNTTQFATTAFVQAAVGAAAGVASFNSRTGAVSLTSGDVTGALTYTPANIASPTFTGTPAGPTATGGTNTTQFATCAFVQSAIAPFAPVASPTFTGVPAAPTASGGTNTTQVATTAFVQTAISPLAPTASPSFTGTPLAPTAGPGNNTTQVATTAYVDAAVAAVQALVMPVGTITTFAANSVPTGFLAADGSAVDRGVYATLFGVIGTTYGIGDGSSTFNLPDLRGEFVRGYDNGRGLDPGRSFGSSQADAFKAHIHSWTGGSNNNNATNLMSNAATSTGVQKDSSSTGGTETRPVNVAMTYCIKF